MPFKANEFVASFVQTLETLTQSEKITKATLQTLSRDVLYALHCDGDTKGDIGYINRTIAVLTPVNKKAFILFCKEFTGFIMNNEGNAFLKKSKKHYDDVSAKALVFLDDPMNNLWSWADRNIEMEKKEFSLDAVTHTIEVLLKKATKNKISQADFMRAVIKGGIDADSIIAIMDDLGFDVQEEPAKQE